jgi:hypothetical protein
VCGCLPIKKTKPRQAAAVVAASAAAAGRGGSLATLRAEALVAPVAKRP